LSVRPVGRETGAEPAPGRAATGSSMRSLHGCDARIEDHLSRIVERQARCALRDGKASCIAKRAHGQEGRAMAWVRKGDFPVFSSGWRRRSCETVGTIPCDEASARHFCKASGGV
jgi:hypothetical protein